MASRQERVLQGIMSRKLLWYPWVPNKRPGTHIYFQKNASLYGPYLALYVYYKKKSVWVCTYWPDNLRKATNSPNLVVNKSWYLYKLSLGWLLEGDPLECCLLLQAAGTGSDCASSHFAYNLLDLPPYTLIWHYTFIRHTRVGLWARLQTLYGIIARHNRREDKEGLERQDPIQASPARDNVKEAIVIWTCLQAQQHLQGVIARYNRRRGRPRKMWLDNIKLDTAVFPDLLNSGQDPMGMGGGWRTIPNGDGWWLKDKTQWGWVVAEG